MTLEKIIRRYLEELIKDYKNKLRIELYEKYDDLVDEEYGHIFSIDLFFYLSQKMSEKPTVTEFHEILFSVSKELNMKPETIRDEAEQDEFTPFVFFLPN